MLNFNLFSKKVRTSVHWSIRASTPRVSNICKKFTLIVRTFAFIRKTANNVSKIELILNKANANFLRDASRVCLYFSPFLRCRC